MGAYCGSVRSIAPMRNRVKYGEIQLNPNSFLLLLVLATSGDGLQPNSDDLQPTKTSDGLRPVKHSHDQS